MLLTPMRYKNYIWPHNPATYSISYERQVAVHKVPFGRYCMQDLGMSCRVIRGQGEFAGEDAYEEFKRLASAFYEDGPGLLVHPLWQVANAYFVSLRVEQEPRPDYVRYAFTFWEEHGLYNGLATRVTGGAAGQEEPGAAQGTGQAVYHRVARGETLWALAGRYGVSLAELVALNPQIKNPNLIRVGEEVRVA